MKFILKVLNYLIKRINPNIDVIYLWKSPFLFFYSAILTYKYVDEWKTFPAIKFKKKIQLKIHKNKNAKIILKGQLIFERWINGNGLTVLNISKNALLEVDNDFLIGDGVKILISEKGKLKLKGKINESASGITANSVIMVNKYVEIGHDCIIAWDTFITDCDWHIIEEKNNTEDTIIKDHVWIGVGAKVLKGVIIERNCIITANSVVTKGQYEEKTMISGIPGKVIKSDIPLWKR